MKLRSVLLDRGFIEALLQPDHPSHRSAVRIYGTLVDGYEDRTKRLYGLSTVLADVPRDVRNTALAPLTLARVAGQHRRAAAHTRVANLPPEAALSLVMMRRERMRAVATVGHDFDRFEIEVLYAAPDAELVESSDAVPEGYVSYETAPLPAPRSTGG